MSDPLPSVMQYSTGHYMRVKLKVFDAILDKESDLEPYTEKTAIDPLVNFFVEQVYDWALMHTKFYGVDFMYHSGYVEMLRPLFDMVPSKTGKLLEDVINGTGIEPKRQGKSLVWHITTVRPKYLIVGNVKHQDTIMDGYYYGVTFQDYDIAKDLTTESDVLNVYSTGKTAKYMCWDPHARIDYAPNLVLGLGMIWLPLVLQKRVKQYEANMGYTAMITVDLKMNFTGKWAEMEQKYVHL